MSASYVKRRHVISSGIILTSHALSYGHLALTSWKRQPFLHLYHYAKCYHLCMVRRKGRNMVHGIQTVAGVCTDSDKFGNACRGSPGKKTNRINAEAETDIYTYWNLLPIFAVAAVGTLQTICL